MALGARFFFAPRLDRFSFDGRPILVGLGERNGVVLEDLDGARDRPDFVAAILLMASREVDSSRETLLDEE